jgi:hypothetical protein
MARAQADTRAHYGSGAMDQREAFLLPLKQASDPGPGFRAGRPERDSNANSQPPLRLRPRATGRG